MTQERRLIFVLGMHRAGTSLLTRLISFAGADLPVNLMPPAAGNETGYWEPAEAVVLNDAFLVSQGLRWHSVEDFPEGWTEGSAAAAFVERAACLLEEEFDMSGLAVFKDPRLCRLFPLWRKAAIIAGWSPVVVLTARNPQEVIASLEKRDEFSASKSALLWLKHIIEAERTSRDLPRAFATYEDVLADWRDVLTRISRDLDLQWPAPFAEIEPLIDNFISDSHRHHRAARPPHKTQDWAARLFTQFAGVRNGVTPEPAVFDEIAAHLKTAETIFLPLVAAAEQRRDAAAKLADQLGKELLFLANLAAGEKKRAADLETELDRRAQAARFDQSNHIDLEQWRIALKPGPAPSVPYEGEIGVFLHIFYTDLAQELATALQALPCRNKIYVSTTDEIKKGEIEAAFLRQGFRDVTVRVFPNRGWDIGAFLLGFTEEIRRHEICLKIHGKKSLHEEESFGTSWRRYLLTQLLGSQERASFAIGAFGKYPTLGLLMAEHWEPIRPYIGIGGNASRLEWLLQTQGVALSPELPIDFPTSSMFWFRSAAIEPYFSLGLGWDDFEATAGSPRDASLAHAIERSFLFYAACAGLSWATLPVV